ncbi:DUF4365 domain-containing protein [Candidatus Raskinella chloraquaticus]|uniref:DUF4365 domain-containing protein n=1 Tax=Candidatus Raskinella chloraquaticus TaxID=1951219 RepID=UPI00378645CE
MIDSLMTPNDREEALSRAYVAAVAAGAGYVTAEPKLDRDGVDIEIHAGGLSRPQLNIQLKATINLGEAANEAYRYALKRRNYDLLRKQTMVPRILVVLSLPAAEVEWLSVTPEQLILRRCAYWASLAGFSETQNNESVTISIHNNNRFDVDSLKALMERARSGAIA